MAETRRLILHLQGRDGQAHQLVGRPAFIAAFIAANADRIGQSERGQLVFNWDGVVLRPEFHERCPQVNTDGT